jgi:hypothetical protein
MAKSDSSDDSKRDILLDRRLLRRRGWIEPADLERALASLPDVGHKAAPLEEADAGPPAKGDGAPTHS